MTQVSEISADYTDRLDLRKIIEDIDRGRAETQKLTQESIKFIAEQQKLMAEAAKLSKDRSLAPWLVATGLAGGVITVIGAIVTMIGVIVHLKI